MEENILRSSMNLNVNIDPKSKISLKNKVNRHVSVLQESKLTIANMPLKRCRKTEYQCFANINKKQIFSLVYKFVGKMLASQDYLKRILKDINFTEIREIRKPAQKTLIIQQHNQFSLQTSKNKISGHSLPDKPETNSKIDIDCEQQNEEFDLRKSNRSRTCKISIMMDMEFQSMQPINLPQQPKSQLFSEESLTSGGISSININQQQFTMQMVQRIYQQPEAFLINLSVCLMLKFLQCSKSKLLTQNVCWILSVGTIIAYKIYYDQLVEGLVDSFAHLLKITRQDIIHLERYFLSAIGHQAVISNQQYHSVLYQIIKEGQKSGK